MPRLKTCRYCGEILHCKSCGQRQTPKSARTARSAVVGIDPKRKARLKAAAKKAGMTLSAYLEKLLDGEEPEKSGRES